MRRFWFKQHIVGGGGSRVSITDQTVTKVGNGLSSATGSISYLSSGTVTGNGATLETWLVSGVNSDYQIRATWTANTTVTTGTLNTWLPLSSTQTWTKTVAPGNDRLTTLLIEIRDAVTLVVLDSATITLDVQNS